MKPSDPLSLPESLLARLQDSEHVLVLTGAGMSAESGIATFRDAQTGLWARYRPEELATPQAFAAHPARVWSWYEERRKTVREAEPHAGHFALVEMEKMVPRLSIVTQNVDALHQRSGSSNVIELHGNIMRSICHLTSRPIDEEWLEKSNNCPPRSPWAKDGLARPDVVWFGESLPAGAMEAAINAAVHCDFCFLIGTTSLVQPAAGLPLLALENGASLVEINPQETPLSPHADHCLRASASEALTAVMCQLKAGVQSPKPGAGAPRLGYNSSVGHVNTHLVTALQAPENPSSIEFRSNDEPDHARAGETRSRHRNMDGTGPATKTGYQ